MNLNSQVCTHTFPDGAVDLATDTSHGPINVYTPGVYCTTATSAASIGTAGITLDGAGTYIFRVNGALTSVAGSNVTTTNGASSCDVFWTPTAATTLAASTGFKGTVIDASGITVGTTTTWEGRALAFGGTVVTAKDTITVPTTCSFAPVAPSSQPPLINVRKVPSPLALPAGPGPVTYNYTVTNPGTVTMTNITLVDDKCSGVTYVSGDSNGNSQMETSETWRYTCATNLTSTTINYATARGLGNGMAAVDTAIAQVLVGIPVVPPLIHIVKTPSPLTLASGGGSATYSYTITNPGTVALTNVTVTDDKCSSVTRVSGDTNGDSRLQSTETWVYTCSMNLTQTTLNTAIATGQANGLTAIDTALATVTVAGLPVPPLIHVLKKPEPAILPAGGGLVTYTYTVTNPGTVRLNNVSVTDDKCGPVVLVSGDVNGNGLMGPTETWTYTCQQTLTTATTNTATARGSANGFNVSSIAVASVTLLSAVIAPPPAPLLPVTGFDPHGQSVAWMLASAAILAAAALLFVLKQWNRLF